MLRKLGMTAAVLGCLALAGAPLGCKKEEEKGGTGNGSGGGGGAAKTKVDQSSPKAAAKTFLNALANGDAETVKQLTSGSDAEKKAAGGMAEALGEILKLAKAAEAKWGKQAAGKMNTDDPAEMVKNVDAGEEKKEGDTVTVTPKGGGKSLKLKEVGGKWHVTADTLLEGQPAEQMTKMAPAMKKAAADVTADVKADKFKTAEEAQTAFSKRMTQAVMGANPTSMPVTPPTPQ